MSEEATEKSLAPSLSELGPEFAETYSNFTAIRALVAAGVIVLKAPWLAVMDLVAGNIGLNISIRKLHRAVKQLQQQMDALTVPLQPERLQSEEIQTLALNTFKEAQYTADAEKVDLYIRILLRAAEGAPYEDRADEYRETVRGMSLREIRIASACYEYQRDNVFNPDAIAANLSEEEFDSWGGDPDRFEQAFTEKLDVARQVVDEKILSESFPDLDQEVLLAYLSRLVGTGLLVPVDHYLGAGPARGTRLHGSYRISLYFREMMEFLGTSNLMGFAQEQVGKAEA